MNKFSGFVLSVTQRNEGRAPHSGETNIWPMEKELLPSRAVFPSKVPPQSEPSVKAVPEPREISEHMVLVPCIV